RRTPTRAGGAAGGGRRGGGACLPIGARVAELAPRTLGAMSDPEIRDSILDTIGDTPLVRLSRIGAGLTPQLVAKLEVFHPGGSIKDSGATRLIDGAAQGRRL